MSLDAAGLKKSVLGLGELELRVEWLKDQISRAPAELLARALNQLCEASEASDPGAREAVLALSLLVIGATDFPAIETLRRDASALRLLSLERLLRRPASSSSTAPAEAEGAGAATDSLRVPDYGAGRELTLGERRNLARRAERTAFDRLLSDPHPKVIAELLHNPRLVEDDVVRLVARRPARGAVLRVVSRSLRWMARARVRQALLLNPGTPPDLSMPLVGVCNRSELYELVHSADIPRVVRAVAHEFLERRPPLPDEGRKALH